MITHRPRVATAKRKPVYLDGCAASRHTNSGTPKNSGMFLRSLASEGGGQYRFTALTGAFGEGESGPVNCPEHPQWRELASMLLDAGADPNDSQSLYNRMFTPGHECLKMLLAHGLGPEARCNWLIAVDGRLCDNPMQTLRYQLNWAINNHQVERARLLIDHGADLGTEEGEPSLFESAMLAGQTELADYLVEKGAERPELDALTQFASACMSRLSKKSAQQLCGCSPFQRSSTSPISIR